VLASQQWKGKPRSEHLWRWRNTSAAPWPNCGLRVNAICYRAGCAEHPLAWRDWASCRSAPALPQLCGFQSACRLPGFIALAADLYEIDRREKSTSVSQSRRDGAVPSLNVKTARSWRGIVATHLAREGRMTVTVGRRELLAALGGTAAAWPARGTRAAARPDSPLWHTHKFLPRMISALRIGAVALAPCRSFVTVTDPVGGGLVARRPASRCPSTSIRRREMAGIVPSDALVSVSWKPHCQMFQTELPKHPGTPARGYSILGWGYLWGRVLCSVGVTEVRPGFAPDVTGCCRPSQSAR
jgi:hypothetical protein